MSDDPELYAIRLWDRELESVAPGSLEWQRRTLLRMLDAERAELAAKRDNLDWNTCERDELKAEAAALKAGLAWALPKTSIATQEEEKLYQQYSALLAPPGAKEGT